MDNENEKIEKAFKKVVFVNFKNSKLLKLRYFNNAMDEQYRKERFNLKNRFAIKNAYLLRPRPKKKNPFIIFIIFLLKPIYLPFKFAFKIYVYLLFFDKKD
ncbi:MAG: hypothetical protein LBC92_00215 [Rickettsiales bacterium]|jgi:hypothetical protein|nr:hypothetical protein [Rickettsiales bacterium]